MKITKLIALVAFIGLFAIGCSKDEDTKEKRNENKTEEIEIQKEINVKLPIEGEFANANGPVGNFSVEFQGKTYQGLDEAFESTIIKMFLNTKEDIYKVILKTPEPNKHGNQYRTLFLRNVKAEKLDIHQDYYFETEKEAIDSEYPPKDDKIGAGHGDLNYGWVNVKKIVKLELLKGTYATEIISRTVNGREENLAQFFFKIGDNGKASFLTKANLGSGNLQNFASFTLNRVFIDKKKGQLIYKIIEATNYHVGREGQFLTIYVKDISANGEKATFAIATKTGIHYLAKNMGDIIGRTLEEAKNIEAPNVGIIEGKGMHYYAHLWLDTTRE